MTIEFIKKAKKDQKTGEENISKIVTQMLSEIEIGGEEKVKEVIKLTQEATDSFSSNPKFSIKNMNKVILFP